jgi:hypothetical protein
MVLERLNRIEAKQDKEAEERHELSRKIDDFIKRWMAGVDLPDETPGQAGSDGRAGSDERMAKPTRLFADYIRVPEKAEVLAQLHQWIDGRQRVKALVYIQAAIEARILEKPPYSAASVEFPGRLGCKSLYYAYVDDETAFTNLDDQETMKVAKDTLRRML